MSKKNVSAFLTKYWVVLSPLWAATPMIFALTLGDPSYSYSPGIE